MYLVDSDIVAELRKAPSGRANSGVIAWAESVSTSSLFISVITLMELEKGIQLKARQDAEAGNILRRWFYEKVQPAFKGRILPIDEAIALENARYHVPDPGPLADRLIAATAKVHGLCVVTRNEKDFRPLQTYGVKLLNPWQ